MSGWVVVATLDAPSGGVFDFPSLSLSSYKLIMVLGSGITVDTDGTDVGARVYSGGSEITTTSYRWGNHLDSSGGSGNTDADNNPSSMLIISNDSFWDVGNAATEGIGFMMTFDLPTSTALSKREAHEGVFTNSNGQVISTEGVSSYNGTGALDGFKIISDHNFTAGKIRVLGLV